MENGANPADSDSAVSVLNALYHVQCKDATGHGIPFHTMRSSSPVCVYLYAYLYCGCNRLANQHAQMKYFYMYTSLHT